KKINFNKEKPGMFDVKQKKKLLEIARQTIRYYLETGKKLPQETDDPALREVMGAFVTLHKNGSLRGCIGNMTGTQPLYLTISDMAIAAAVEDPRFRALTLNELDNVDIEISVLSPMRKISSPDEIDIGKHGVMVKRSWQSGVYLPQVAEETGWSKEQFMDSLCAHKADIPADSWRKGECDIYIFTAEVFGEKETDK
ncbi:MAG: AmmeMemoRadiSam system protein A, partial [Candidatus Omnitrophota bacterium]